MLAQDLPEQGQAARREEELPMIILIYLFLLFAGLLLFEILTAPEGYEGEDGFRYGREDDEKPPLANEEGEEA